MEPPNKGPVNVGMSHYVPYLEVSFTGRLNKFYNNIHFNINIHSNTTVIINCLIKYNYKKT